MVNEAIGILVRSKSLSCEAAGMAKQTNSKIDILVLSFRSILWFARI